MRPQDIIRKKRDGHELTREEIEFFVRGVTTGDVADYQTTALLMAIFLNGMNEVEQSTLTNAMLHSGDILDFSDISKPKADKHSTGGVHHFEERRCRSGRDGDRCENRLGRVHEQARAVAEAGASAGGHRELAGRALASADHRHEPAPGRSGGKLRRGVGMHRTAAW